MIFRLIVCIVVLPCLFMTSFASPGEESDELQLTSVTNLEKYLHKSYFTDLQISSSFVLERNDQKAVKNYTGSVQIDRRAVSKLQIRQKTAFEMTYTDSSAAIRRGEGNPTDLDLSNPAHNILEFREIHVLEFNPLRYLAPHHDFYLDLSSADTLVLVARWQDRMKRTGEIKIMANKKTGLIEDMFFYSTSGDLGRHVTYGSFVEIHGHYVPAEVTIRFPLRAAIVREHYIFVDFMK